MIPYNFNLTIDFEKDWKDYIRLRLESYSFLKKEDIDNLNDEDISYVFFELKNRLISQSQRTVYFSNEFNCHRSLQTGLNDIVNKIKSGNDLTPHLSRRIKDLNTVDGLLNDWGIHHLHLGTEIDSDGFTNRYRRGELLYVLFNESSAYLIQIMDHRSFSKKELLRIIHNNWPNIIEPYRMNGIKLFPANITDNHISQFRNAGITTLVQIDEDTVYAPIGGGITGAGTSTKATMTSHRYHNQIKLYEQRIKTNFHYYLSKINETTGKTPPNIWFKLLIDSKGDIFAYEVHSEVYFQLNS
ncbi:hypothetical protein NST33_17990 [Paenibacillus sp. FSL L8-0435]|uniref:hypothetical protein n=1 Tax=Paenibacillus sp. FSL L8-0435 TaxID=2954618 RepID=UPI0030DC94B3